MSNKQNNDKPKKTNKFSRFFNDIFSFLKNERLHQIIGLTFLLTSICLLIAFTSYLFTWKTDQSKVLNPGIDLILDTDPSGTENWIGNIGAFTAHYFIHNWVGISSYVFVLWFFLIGYRILFKRNLLPLYKTFKYSLFTLIFASLTFGLFFSDSYPFLGGSFGYILSNWLITLAGNIGAGLLLFFIFACFLILTFNIRISNLFNFFQKSKIQNVTGTEPSTPENKYLNDTPALETTEPTQPELSVGKTIEFETLLTENITEPSEEETIPEAVIENKEPQLETEIDSRTENISLDIEQTEKEAGAKSNIVAIGGDYDPTLDLSSYQYPTLDLLEQHAENKAEVSAEELEANKNNILKTLGHYNIQIDKIKATIGPTVTLYEIVPAPGIRISKIKNLENDIALSLAALGIRIIAPIPGKGTIGIEVPNSKSETVSMRSVLDTERFQQTAFDLPVAIGKTISNEVYITDLTKMPHLLMAGATGKGKSVGLNVILTSLLYKKHPSQVKFVMVDPKMVELTLYKKIERHFLAKLPNEAEAIITETQKVVHTLNSLCTLMETRLELLNLAQVRNIKEYNTKFINRQLNPNNGHAFLPYIVVIIDEFADLIMTVGKEVELPIARLAQKARAVGIHLIIATQRPSVNIITGTIKANFPARIAFKVTSLIDSRTILDYGGAEQLVGRGDMLFSMDSEIKRIQCAFVDTSEVEKITRFIGEQQGYPDSYLLPEFVDTSTEEKGAIDTGERDTLFDEAARIVVQHNQGSTSLIQRRLKLGYNRAGRLIDQLEAAKIVGPFEGSKAREVLITDLYALEQYLQELSKKDPTE